jgi:hypothetical protein
MPVRKVKYAALLIAVVISMVTAGKAGAAPEDQIATQICMAISSQPTPAGVMATAQAMLDLGLTTREVSLLIYHAVHEYCPEMVPVLDEFVRQG